MLTIYSPDQSSAVPLSIPDDKWFVVHKYNGKDTLSFDISPEHECYPLIGEEIRIGTAENRYIIKDIDEHGGVAQIDCEIDIDDWRKRVWKEYRATNSLLSEVLEQICPEGWSISGAGISSKHMTVEASEGIPMKAVTAEEILYRVIEIYEITVNFDVFNRILYVINPDTYTPSGEFFIKDLNLRSVGFNGSSKGFATRLYAWGKDDITFASVNGGKEYVEDNSYSDRVISVGWKDERYTIPQNLLDAAKKKLELLAFPVRSYECDIANLNNDMWLYKVVTLVDGQRKTRINHQVVEYKEFPKRPDLDVVMLSTSPPKVEASIKKIYDDFNETSELNKSELLTEIDRATGLMTGAAGGHVVIRTINGVPEEILIMDAADMSTAQKVWRWNLNGFAHSSKGINGPYTTAITIDGKIIADFILAGTLSANLIRGGILKSQNERIYLNLNDGDLQINDYGGNMLLKMNDGGIGLYGGIGSSQGLCVGQITRAMNNNAKYGTMIDTGEYGEWIALSENWSSKFSYDKKNSGIPGLNAFTDLNMHGYAVKSASNLMYNSAVGYPTAMQYVSNGNYVQLAVNYGMDSQFFRGIALFESDGRLKENIRPTEMVALDELMQWKHRTFEWKNSGETEACGYIAQEMEKVNPAYVLKVGEKGNEVYQMDERRLIPVMSKAIQELKVEVDSLQKQIDLLTGVSAQSVSMSSSRSMIAKEQISQYEDTLITKVEGPILPESPPVITPTTNNIKESDAK